jgi:hypothetical protein
VGGKSLGVHPGVAFPPDPAVVALAGTGLGLVSGTGGIPTDTNTVTTAGSGRSGINLIGNDEMTNPKLISNSNTNNGTNPGGILLEAELHKISTRYFCAAIFLPSDSGVSAPNAAGDNAGQSADLTYYMVASAAQMDNRTVN